MSHHPVYRGEQVHVLTEKCATCIFRPHNLMSLREGRVKEMVDACLARDTVIPCHSTIHTDEVEPAICRGFFDSYGEQITALRLAAALHVLAFDPPPP